MAINYTVLAVTFYFILLVNAAHGGVFTCCSPKEWRATVRTLRLFLEGKGNVAEYVTWQTVNYDATNQRVSVSVFNVTDPTREILDFSKGFRYEIRGEGANQKCVRYPYTQHFQAACVPENTTSVYFARIGEPSSPAMWANTAYYTDDDVMGYVTVTIKDCAFVSEVTYSKISQDRLSQTVQYFNQTLQVDPVSFNIPPNCISNPKGTRETSWQKYGVLGKLI